MSKHSGAPGQKNKQPTSPQERPNQKHDPAGGQIAPISEDRPSPRNPHQPEKRWYHTINGWKVALEIVAIPFAIGYAVVTYYQWNDLRHNFQVEQQALLKVDWGFSPDAAGVNITIKNVGKSVALRAVADARFEIVDRKQTPTFSLEPKHNTVYAAFIYPGDKTDLPVRHNPDEMLLPPRRFTDEERISLARGETYLAVFGQAVYADQFGNHWIRFCDWQDYVDASHVGTQLNSRACLWWTGMGDGPPPKN